MKALEVKYSRHFATILFVLSTSILLGQSICLPSIDGVRPGDEPPGCRICSWGTYTGSTGGMSPESSPINAPCSVENSQWLHFRSTQTKIFEAKIQAYSCNLGKGIEAVLFDKNLNPVSDCLVDKPINGASFLRVENLIPFETYHLMIDGVDGDICGFRFEPVRGLYLPESGAANIMICPGDCVQFADSCYSESTDGLIEGYCEEIGPLIITNPELGYFEVNFFIDSFINSYAINWKPVIGRQHYEIYIDNSFVARQHHSSFLLPISNPKDSVKFKVVPVNLSLDCDFYQSEITCYTSESTSSSIEKTEKPEIIIFPNPNQGFFKIETDFKIEKVEVFDINVKQISATTSSFSNQIEVEITEKESGIYFLKIYSKNQTFIKKIILH